MTLSLATTAQTQQGYVKAKGCMVNDSIFMPCGEDNVILAGEAPLN